MKRPLTPRNITPHLHYIQKEKLLVHIKKIKVSFISVPISIIVTLALSYVFFTNSAFRSKPDLSNMPCTETATMEQIRLKNFNFIQPLLTADTKEESTNLQLLKLKIDQYVNNKHKSGELMSASVYVRKLNNGEWINVHPNEGYQPGSLLKLPLLLTLFKLSEEDPGLLNKTILNNLPKEAVPSQTFASSSLIQGKSYTVLDLMYAMVTNSDNVATGLLHSFVTHEQYDRVYTDLGLSAPPHTDMNYTMTSADYCKFFRVLFNATYLNQKNSDFALMMLSKSSYAQGLHDGVPQGIVVANKFGEHFGPGYHVLHDVGIVYANNEPYLIAVMTKGSDVNKLATVISDISQLTYDYWTTSFPLRS